MRRAHLLKREHRLSPRAGVVATAPASRYLLRLAAMAFLAPDIQAAILAGRQPPALTMKRIIHEPTPLAWVDQRHAFHAETPSA